MAADFVEFVGDATGFGAGVVGFWTEDEFVVEEVEFAWVVEIVDAGSIFVVDEGAEKVVGILVADSAEAFIPEADGFDGFWGVAAEVVTVAVGDEGVFLMGEEECLEAVIFPEGVVLGVEEDVAVGGVEVLKSVDDGLVPVAGEVTAGEVGAEGVLENGDFVGVMGIDVEG